LKAGKGRENQNLTEKNSVGIFFLVSFRAVLFPSSLSKKEQCVISVEETSYTTDKIRENTLKFLKEGKKGELRGETKRKKQKK
jgi:hypothetical protein